MITILEKKDCCGCESCANICPKCCISMERDPDGFLYPEVNKTECIRCGLCNAACPIENYHVPERKPTAYGAINKDETVRAESSSGGVFFELCKYVIYKNGVVFGAAFDAAFDVCHTYAKTIDDCKRFMGSKYSQSLMGSNYQDVKRFLCEGRWVLFTGTPCQVSGLYQFLGKLANHEKLITQDIVCHSVPSPEKWKEYKKAISGDRIITDIRFRSKETGWRSGTFRVEFSDGSEYKELYSKTDYMKGFLQGDYSRPSCYKCIFSRLERHSDITLGDFWGVEGLYPALYDNKGTSVVLINSKKGKKIYKEIAKSFLNKKVRLDYAVKYNPAISQREKMFQSISE